MTDIQDTMAPVKINKVLELRWSPQNVVYAHITTAEDEGKLKEYALIAEFPRHGFTFLGDISPETGRFEEYAKVPTFYTRADNNVINSMNVPIGHLSQARTLDEVLQTENMELGFRISIERTLVPK